MSPTRVTITAFLPSSVARYWATAASRPRRRRPKRSISHESDPVSAQLL